VANNDADNKQETATPVESPAQGIAAHKKGLISPVVADTIGIGGSVLAAGATAKFYVDTSLYKNMSSLGLFDKMKPARRARFKEIETLRDSGKITGEQSYQMVQSLVKHNETRADELLGRLGANNWMERAGLLRRHQKAEAAVWAMAAGGVALGSVLQLTRFASEEEEQLAGNGGTVKTVP